MLMLHDAIYLATYCGSLLVTGISGAVNQTCIIVDLGILRLQYGLASAHILDV